MGYYPINLQIAGRQCAVIGGGTVAARKVKSLLAADAIVTVVSPELTATLDRMAQQGRIRWARREFQAGDTQDYFLVICATDNSDANQAVYREARQNGVLVNVVDVPELCDFTIPAQVTRGDLLLTVSTGGKSPMLARRLREELESLYGPEYGQYLELVAEIRRDIRQRMGAGRDREVFWRESLNSEILLLLRQGRLEDAKEKIIHAAGSIGTES